MWLYCLTSNTLGKCKHAHGHTGCFTLPSHFPLSIYFTCKWRLLPQEDLALRNCVCRGIEVGGVHVTLWPFHTWTLSTWASGHVDKCVWWSKDKLCMAFLEVKENLYLTHEKKKKLSASLKAPGITTGPLQSHNTWLEPVGRMFAVD